MFSQNYRHRKFSSVFILFAAIQLIGCAGYSIKKDGTDTGYDVYRPEPYLLVTAGKEAQTAEIIYLPNYNQRYRIKTWNFLGKADFQFTIEGGWKLTNISDKSDNTTVASKLLDVVQKSARPDAISLSGNTQLFKITFDETTGDPTGLKLIPFN